MADLGDINASNFGLENATSTGFLKSLGNSLNGALKSALFMEAARNINWSRGYLWYCELDGVPNPFQRGGVIGLPVSSLQFNLTGQGSDFTIENNATNFSIPQRTSSISNVSLTMFDDEKGTLRTFFERWHNEVYNPYYGVLPLAEACKCLSIYFQKTTRRNVQRAYEAIRTDLHSSSQTTGTKNGNTLSMGIGTAIKQTIMAAVKGHATQSTDCINFLVYPTSTVTVSGLSSNGNEPITVQVSLNVAHFQNQDFGEPTTSTGIQSILGQVTGVINNNEGAGSWINKITNYI